MSKEILDKTEGSPTIKQRLEIAKPEVLRWQRKQALLASRSGEGQEKMSPMYSLCLFKMLWWCNGLRVAKDIAKNNPGSGVLLNTSETARDDRVSRDTVKNSVPIGLTPHAIVDSVSIKNVTLNHVLIFPFNDLFWAVHPGGSAILNRLEGTLKLNTEKLESSRLIERARRTVHGSADDIGWMQRASRMPSVEDGTERFMEILDNIGHCLHNLSNSMVYLLVPGIRISSSLLHPGSRM
ncbi:hypothetical protein GH714_018990 [Hevea brasiliensis]|uniref:Chalcone/stilbene synthase C-terminal domain-containing protein n=1 Tax=Hevea brasiliensis TaxID=3981 RepID=A0A6A6LSR1_HEVBR|nr:hypothetical protein GH714_018990 [Hevea brasiliensis]